MRVQIERQRLGGVGIAGVGCGDETISQATLAYKRGDPGWLSIRVWRRSQIAYVALCSGQLTRAMRAPGVSGMR
jgi:hypothetical protein